MCSERKKKKKKSRVKSIRRARVERAIFYLVIRDCASDKGLEPRSELRARGYLGRA